MQTLLLNTLFNLDRKTVLHHTNWRWFNGLLVQHSFNICHLSWSKITWIHQWMRKAWGRPPMAMLRQAHVRTNRYSSHSELTACLLYADVWGDFVRTQWRQWTKQNSPYIRWSIPIRDCKKGHRKQWTKRGDSQSGEEANKWKIGWSLDRWNSFAWRWRGRFQFKVTTFAAFFSSCPFLSSFSSSSSSSLLSSI